MWRSSLILIFTLPFALTSTLFYIGAEFLFFWFLFFCLCPFPLHITDGVTKCLHTFSLRLVLCGGTLDFFILAHLSREVDSPSSWYLGCSLNLWFPLLSFIRRIIDSSFFSLPVVFRILCLGRSFSLLFWSSGDCSRNRFFEGVFRFIIHDYFLLIKCPEFESFIGFNLFSILVEITVTNVFCCDCSRESRYQDSIQRQFW